jgi:tRNA 2-thiouridine synthesizing protein A
MPDTIPSQTPTEAKEDRYLDAKGLYCPEPIMLLHQVMADMEVGQIVKVVATDPSTERDLPKFCQFLGHRLAERRLVDGEFHYWVEKQG